MSPASRELHPPPGVVVHRMERPRTEITAEAVEYVLRVSREVRVTITEEADRDDDFVEQALTYGMKALAETVSNDMASILDATAP